MLNSVVCFQFVNAELSRYSCLFTAESEKYRNSLRRKDQEKKELEESAQLHQLEVQKWSQQREALEATHLITEQELAIARLAQTELEDQKQENLVLKETIDRLRFDLDELRTREHAGSGGPSATTSQFGSVSKSLGAELMNRWESMSQDEEATEVAEEGDGDGDEDSETDGEEMIQTIITRKTRVRRQWTLVLIINDSIWVP